MIFLLFGLRTKRITLKSIKKFFLSLVWEQKGSHSRASILFSPRLETKSIIHKSIKRYLFSPVWEQKRSHTRASIGFSSLRSGKKMATHKSSKTFFFMCSGTKKASIFFLRVWKQAPLGTKSITQKSIKLVFLSASGNKKDHTQGHQFFLHVWELKGSHARAAKVFLYVSGNKNSINFFLRVWKQAPLGTKSITQKSIKLVFLSASGNKKDHTQGHQFFSPRLGTKRITRKKQQKIFPILFQIFF